MKKISILLIAVVATIASHAQQWVSTTPGNKKALIEEYTGHTCVWCPAGHKIVDDLIKANPGKVYGVNIHTGSFATTDAFYPLDMRTSGGDVLAGASGLTGYPAGTVNRNDSPWAVSRDKFASKTATILTQPSPVNVAVRSSFDKKTGMLKAEVEVYYTAAGVGTFNRLSVFVVQDSILGPQTGGTTHYPANFVGGQYIHKHVLRLLMNRIVGGDTVTPIASGTYKKYTYEALLPNTIRNVNVDLNNLYVLAFVSETTAKILNADKVKVTVDNTPVGLSFDHSDAGTDLTFCTDQISPKVMIQNNSSTNLTSFKLTAEVNGVLTTQTFNDAINAGQSKIVTFTPISFTQATNGLNSVKVHGLFNINNGNFYDNSTFMDNFDKTFIALKPNDFSGDKTFNWETVSPIVYLTNDPVVLYPLSKTNFKDLTTDVGAESSTHSMMVRLHSSWNNVKPNSILFGRASIPAAGMKFSYHYAYSNGTATGAPPKILFSYSLDCGATWKRIDSIACTQTKVITGNTLYIPVSSEYIKREVDLAEVKGKTNVIFRLTASPDTSGNALWLDQFAFKSSGAGSTSTKIMDDSTRKTLSTIGLTATEIDITGIYKNLVDNDNVTWTITDIKMATGWIFTQICDFNCYENATVGLRKTFNYTPTYNNLKPTIKHDKKPGYGWVSVRTFKTSDSAKTVVTTKFALLVTASASIAILSDASEKLLYYFDNKIFVDREFNGAQLDVYDLNGKSVLSAKVNSDNIDFTPLTGGIYIARISRDGQVMKTHKFNTSK